MIMNFTIASMTLAKAVPSTTATAKSIRLPLKAKFLNSDQRPPALPVTRDALDLRSTGMDEFLPDFELVRERPTDIGTEFGSTSKLLGFSHQDGECAKKRR